MLKEVVFDLETQRFFDDIDDHTPAKLGVSIVSLYTRTLDSNHKEIEGQMLSYWEREIDQLWEHFQSTCRPPTPAPTRWTSTPTTTPGPDGLEVANGWDPNNPLSPGPAPVPALPFWGRLLLMGSVLLVGVLPAAPPGEGTPTPA